MCSTCGVFLLTSHKQNILPQNPIHPPTPPSYIQKPFLKLRLIYTYAQTKSLVFYLPLTASPSDIFDIYNTVFICLHILVHLFGVIWHFCHREHVTSVITSALGIITGEGNVFFFSFSFRFNKKNVCVCACVCVIQGIYVSEGFSQTHKEQHAAFFFF